MSYTNAESKTMTNPKFTIERYYDKGYGYTRIYSYGDFTIQREGREKEFGGWEDKGYWLILYKGEMFEGVTGALRTLKLAKSVVVAYLKMGY